MFLVLDALLARQSGQGQAGQRVLGGCGGVTGEAWSNDETNLVLNLKVLMIFMSKKIRGLFSRFALW